MEGDAIIYTPAKEKKNVKFVKGELVEKNKNCIIF